MDGDNITSPSSSHHHEARYAANPNMSNLSSPLSVNTSARMTANYKVDLWNKRNFDSGFQTMNHSEAPSIISSIHPSSHMSDLSSIANGDPLTEQQRMKFDGIGLGGSETLYEHAIPELTELIRDKDQAVVYKAVIIMQNIAKMDCDSTRRQKPVITDFRVIIALRDVLKDRVQFPNIMKVALGTLFHICNRQDGLDLVSYVASREQDLIYFLVHHIDTLQSSCYKYALLTLHSLLSDKQNGQTLVAIARRTNALRLITKWLENEKSEKLLPVIVDLIRLLSEKQNDQKMIFMGEDGPRKLLMVIQNYSYESLLCRSVQLLNMFSNFDAQKVVVSGARPILARLLEHESQRLVKLTLECLRIMSDVPSVYEDRRLLYALLRILGVRDQTISLYTVQIISNICANNKDNKEFLVTSHAVENLLRVLKEEIYNPTPKEREMNEEIAETVLCTLKNLCVGHNLVDRVQLLILHDPSILLDRLVSMRPVLLRHSLYIMTKVSQHSANHATIRDFRNSKTGFIDQIVHILRVSCNHLSKLEQIEGVKVRELIQFSMSVLAILSRDVHIKSQIITSLKRADNAKVNETSILLPIFVLQANNLAETSKQAALQLLCNIHYNNEMSDYLEGNQPLINTLTQIGQTSTLETAQMADFLREKLDKNPQNVNFGYSNDISSGSSHANYSLYSDDMMESSEEVVEGAGEQWPQDLSLTDDPFASVFVGREAGNHVHEAPLPVFQPMAEDIPLQGPCNSPSYNRGYVPMPEQPYYWHQQQQPMQSPQGPIPPPPPPPGYYQQGYDYQYPPHTYPGGYQGPF